MTAPDAKRQKVLEAGNGRVIEVPAKLMTVHGAPKYLRSDNGPELVSAAILRWLSEVSVETAHIDPGRPWQNGTDESFSGKFRDECLGMEWFRSWSEAAAIIETWRRHYNKARPRSSLGYRTPHALTKQHEQSEATHGGEAVLQLSVVRRIQAGQRFASSGGSGSRSRRFRRRGARWRSGSSAAVRRIP